MREGENERENVLRYGHSMSGDDVEAVKIVVKKNEDGKRG